MSFSSPSRRHLLQEDALHALASGSVSSEERQTIREVLHQVALLGTYVHPWPLLRTAIVSELRDVGICLNERRFAERFPESAPFTIGRLCELALDGMRLYRKKEALQHAIDRVLSVTSTLPQARSKIPLTVRAPRASTPVESLGMSEDASDGVLTRTPTPDTFPDCPRSREGATFPELGAPVSPTLGRDFIPTAKRVKASLHASTSLSLSLHHASPAAPACDELSAAAAAVLDALALPVDIGKKRSRNLVL